MKNIRITKWEYPMLLDHIDKGNEYIIHFNIGRAQDRDIGEYFLMPMISRHGIKGVIQPELDFTLAPVVKLIYNDYLESVYAVPNELFRFSFAAKNKQELIKAIQKRYGKSYEFSKNGGISEYGISCSMLQLISE